MSFPLPIRIAPVPDLRQAIAVSRQHIEALANQDDIILEGLLERLEIVRKFNDNLLSRFFDAHRGDNLRLNPAKYYYYPLLREIFDAQRSDLSLTLPVDSLWSDPELGLAENIDAMFSNYDYSLNFGQINKAPMRGYEWGGPIPDNGTVLWVPAKRAAIFRMVHMIRSDDGDTKVRLDHVMRVCGLDTQSNTWEKASLWHGLSFCTGVLTRRRLNKFLRWHCMALAEGSYDRPWFVELCQQLYHEEGAVRESFEKELEELACRIPDRQLAIKVRQVTIPFTQEQLAVLCQALDIPVEERAGLVKQLKDGNIPDLNDEDVAEITFTAKLTPDQQYAEWLPGDTNIISLKELKVLMLQAQIFKSEADNQHRDMVDKVNLDNFFPALESLREACRDLNGNDSQWQEAASLAKQFHRKLKKLTK